MTRAELVTLIESTLKNSQDTRLLRGVTKEGNDTGDLDFIVSPGKSIKSALIVVNYLEDCGWSLIYRVDLGYVCSIFISKPSVSFDAVYKVDFIEGISWRGLVCENLLADPFSALWSKIHNNWSDNRIVGFFTFLQKIMSSGYVSQTEWLKISETGCDEDYIYSICLQAELPLSRIQISNRRLATSDKWQLRFASSGGGTLNNIVPWTIKVLKAVCVDKFGFSGSGGLIIGISGLEDAEKGRLIDRYCNLLEIAKAPVPKLFRLFADCKISLFSCIEMTSVQHGEKPLRENLKSHILCIGKLAYHLPFVLMTLIFLKCINIKSKLIVLNEFCSDYAIYISRCGGATRYFPIRLVSMLTPRGLMLFHCISAENMSAQNGDSTRMKLNECCNKYFVYGSACNVNIIDLSRGSEFVFDQFLCNMSKHFKCELEDRG